MSAFEAEVREQPAVLRRVRERAGEAGEVAAALVAFRPALVRLVGHGSSDAAAVYATYAFGLLPGWTALRDSISLAVHYEAALDVSRSVVIALSQSGRTPDVVDYLTRARAREALTVAITNAADSALAGAADHRLLLSAGEERAVAASKTYVATLATVALLAAGCAGRLDEIAAALGRTADLADTVLKQVGEAVDDVVEMLADVRSLSVIGRGLELATARELALKLKETCRIAAEPLSATALLHGPVAALGPGSVVWALAGADPALPAVAAACERARAAGAFVLATGSAAGAVDADRRIELPPAPLPVLAPLLSVLPGQLLAARLAAARGLDPDHPAGLAKVTLAG